MANYAPLNLLHLNISDSEVLGKVGIYHLAGKYLLRAHLRSRACFYLKVKRRLSREEILKTMRGAKR
jgi:hypothetical protein